MSQDNNSNRFKIPYHAFVKITGNLKAGLLLHTLCFWWFVMSGKRGNDDVEFYKSRQELTNETSLTTQEQRTALSLLQNMDLVSFRSIGFKRSLWYRVNHNKINDLLKTDGKNSLKIAHLLPEQQIDLLPEQQLHCNNIIYSLKESELLRNSPDSQNPPAEDLEIPLSAQEKPGAQPMTTPEPLDDLATLLADGPTKRRKVGRPRKAREQRMMDAKRAPDEFTDAERKIYEDRWVPHMAHRGCSAVNLEEAKATLLHFKQKRYDIEEIVRYYVSENCYSLSKARIEADIERGYFTRIPTKLTLAASQPTVPKRPTNPFYFTDEELSR